LSRDNLLRLRLRVTLKLMAFAALLLFLMVILRALFSPPGGDVRLPLEVDLRGIEPGEHERLIWSGRRVLVLHRDATMLGALPDDDALYDPNSRFDRRPRRITTSHRGWVPEWLVVYAESTDLGCDLEIVPPRLSEGWEGGLRDRCRGGRYDFAGRVYKGQPAMRNLEIPPYRLEGRRLILGVD
jgi:ubiquinol-cytochrome c reductase iron-sulfur subunit